MTEAQLTSAQDPGQIPSGTVTFLFTDIEGSTRLLERLREQYATVLSDQRAIMRESFGHWNGHEIDTQGDSFFVAFPRAIDALYCVVEAQKALVKHEWPQNASVRVRMGLHTGEPIIGRTGYVGMDVHRTARIAAAGHGGQVLLSQTTHDLVHLDLPKGTALRNLGAHKLKDIRYPQQIYQLEIEGLPSEYPTLKTLSAEEAPPTPGEPPYKGLQYFNEEDAEWFFGRQDVTARLVEVVISRRFLAVIGASGSGKSSVVRAGLVPELKRNRLGERGGGERIWQIYILTPGAHPLENLAVALSRNSDSAAEIATLIDDLGADSRSLHLHVQKTLRSNKTVMRLLLVVDQFEELFTLCRSESERLTFIQNLLYATIIEGGPITALITLRADFYERLAQYTELREMVSGQQVYIGSMSAAELREAIEEPARHGGWEFSPGLVDLILHDIGAREGSQPEPGALPLLSHALLETWKRRRGNLMNLRAYTEAGGVRGAIAHTAESVYYRELTPSQQGIARNIFLRLTELGEGTQDTRRRISIHELIPPGPAGDAELIQDVLVKLADARLITTSEETVEVAHEALIREWPTLREWLAQDREGLRLHRHLTEAAQEWELLEHDPGALYRGARLAQAVEWALANPRALSAQEQSFLEASREAAEREQAEREAARERELEAAQKLAETERQRAEEQAKASARLRQRAVYLTLALGASIVLLLATVWLGQLANRNARTAQEQARLATSRELAAASVSNLQIDPERSVLLALHALSTSDTLEARNALHQALPELHLLHTIQAHTQAPGLAISPDGGRLASIGVNGEAKIWDAFTYQQLLSLAGDPGDFGFNIAFSADGKLVAALASTKIVFWDSTTGRKLFSLSGDLYLPNRRNHMSFSPDGKSLAVANMDGVPKVWDLTNQEELFSLAGHEQPCDAIDYSPDGKRLATGDDMGVIKIWEAETGKELSSFIQGGLIHSVAFSPDGARLAVAGEDGILKIWDLSTGKELLSLPRLSGIYEVDFMPDGQGLIATHQDSTVSMWDSFSGVKMLTLAGHLSTALGIAISPDGERIMTSGYDGTVRIWDPSPGREIQTLTGHTGSVYDIAYSPDGTQLATIGQDGTAILWDAESGGRLKTLVQQEKSGELMSLASDPQGKRLAAGGWDGVLQIWDLATGQTVLRQSAHAAPISGLAFTPDGKRLASSGWDETAKVWDLVSQKAIVIFTNHGKNMVEGIAISPDGKVVYSSGDDGYVRLWDSSTGQELQKFDGAGDDAYGVAISPDGKLLAIGWDNGYVTIWNISTGEKLHEFSAHAGLIFRMAFNSDGTQLASAAFDKYAKVWDVATGQELATLYGNASNVFGVSFSLDGSRLATAGGDGLIRIYTLQIENLVELARSRLTRSLTEEECRKYLHVEACPP